MRSSSESDFEKYLVITFVSATHVLAMNAEDELDEATVPGFATDAMTLYCGALDHGRMVQASCYATCCEAALESCTHAHTADT